MTTPERVAKILGEDDELSVEQAAALAELFRVADDDLILKGDNEQCPESLVA